MRLSNGAYFAGRRACRQKTEVNARLGVIVLGFIVGVPIGLLVFLVSGFSMPAALAAFVLWFAYLNRQRKREMLQRMTPAAFSISLHRRPIESHGSVLCRPVWLVRRANTPYAGFATRALRRSLAIAAVTEALECEGNGLTARSQTSLTRQEREPVRTRER